MKINPYNSASQEARHLEINGKIIAIRMHKVENFSFTSIFFFYNPYAFH